MHLFFHTHLSQFRRSPISHKDIRHLEKMRQNGQFNNLKVERKVTPEIHAKFRSDILVLAKSISNLSPLNEN